jgi:hypothetical protein
MGYDMRKQNLQKINIPKDYERQFYYKVLVC